MIGKLLHEVNCPICSNKENATFWIMNEISNSNTDNYRYVKCAQCQCVYASPRRIDIEYYQNLPSSYLSNLDTYVKSISVEGLMWMLDEFEKKWFKNHQSRGSMLEMGCAMGHFLFCARARNWKTQGIEFVKEAAEWARNNLQLDVKDTPAETSAIKEKSFDSIIGIELIEHVREPFEILKNIKKWLKGDGMVFFSTPNIESHSLKSKEPWGVLDPRDHLTLFSKKTITELLNKAGFSSVEILNFGGNWRRDESLFIFASKNE